MTVPPIPGTAHEDAQSIAKGLSAVIGAEVPASVDADTTPCLDVPREQWAAAALYLRDSLGLDFFDWLSAVDIPDGDPAGVDVVLHVAATSSAGERSDHAASNGGRRRVRRMLLRTRVPDADLSVASLTAVWPGVAWHERETFEMFGVGFDGFDDGSGGPLRPLLLPEGFEGTPLRKSFVLAARASKPWPGAKEPGESEGGAPSRRKVQPPGVPDVQTWGPRSAGSASAGSASVEEEDGRA